MFQKSACIIHSNIFFMQISSLISMMLPPVLSRLINISEDALN